MKVDIEINAHFRDGKQPTTLYIALKLGCILALSWILKNNTRESFPCSISLAKDLHTMRSHRELMVINVVAKMQACP